MISSNFGLVTVILDISTKFWYFPSSHINQVYLIHHRDLIQANGLREKQIVAAEKVIRLLCAPARNLDPLAERHQGGWFPRNTPSKIAATAVLHHAKPWLSSVGCHYYTNV